MPTTVETEFADRLTEALLAYFHEYGYIDDSVMCGTREDGTEYHNGHENVRELVIALVELDAKTR